MGEGGSPAPPNGRDRLHPSRKLLTTILFDMTDHADSGKVCRICKTSFRKKLTRTKKCMKN